MDGLEPDEKWTEDGRTLNPEPPPEKYNESGRRQPRRSLDDGPGDGRLTMPLKTPALIVSVDGLTERGQQETQLGFDGYIRSGGNTSTWVRTFFFPRS